MITILNKRGNAFYLKSFKYFDIFQNDLVYKVFHIIFDLDLYRKLNVYSF